MDEKYGSFANPYTYTGKELDSEVGLYYYGARYYNAGFSRFTSVDPALFDLGYLQSSLSDPQSLNSYAYVRNNPIRFIDPNGNTFWDALKKWGVILGTTVLDMLDIIPGTGDISDVYASLTGKTLFTQQELSEEDINMILALAIEPIITGGELRLLDDIPEEIKKIIEKVYVGIKKIVSKTSLSDNIIKTFEKGVSKREIIEEKKTIFRIWGGDSKELGGFFGTVKPKTKQEAKELYNLPEGNSMENITTFDIPIGTETYIGNVEGGKGVQIYIPNYQDANLTKLEQTTLED